MSTENITLPFTSGQSVTQMHTRKQKHPVSKEKKKSPCNLLYCTSSYPTIYTKLSSAEHKTKQVGRGIFCQPNTWS